MKRRSLSPRRAGYSLIEGLVAAAILAAGIAAAASLAASMTQQEELARGQSAAVRLAETIARIWQMGADPSAVLLRQTQGLPGSSGVNPMTWSLSAISTVSLGADSGVSQGAMEQTTVTVTYTPSGAATQATVTLTALRPPAIHR